jgi:cytochrome c oxidase subunit 3
MALAVHAAEAGRRRQLIVWLSSTIVFGVAFLVIKFAEYAEHYRDHLVPFFGWPFLYDGPAPEQARIYFNLYFLMTAAHAVHMTVGVGVLAVLVVLAARGKLLGERASPVHVSGLYWHFVDIVWVWLYPLLYLIGAG